MRALLCTVVFTACATPPRSIIVPSDAVAPPESPSRPVVHPYVVRMSDGQRTWQVEIPSVDATGAFEVSIPLNLEASGQVVPTKEPTVVPTTGAERPAGDTKYFAALARISELYRKKQYELALVEITRLEAEHPDDERILEMKGTLYLRLKRPELARSTWERVLAKNPDNMAVTAALSTLTEE